MKVFCETSLENFQAWSGAVETKDRILEEGKANDFDAIIEDLYFDGIDETDLNDLLWFESDWIYESLGINSEDDNDDESEDE